MHPTKPAASQPATDDKKEVAKPSGTRCEDWIDKLELMEKFNVSSRTVDYYVAQGILNCMHFGGRQYFYLPGIMHSVINGR